MMGAGGITNVGPINTQTTGKGAIMGFDPILGMSRRRTKKRKKQQVTGQQLVQMIMKTLKKTTSVFLLSEHMDGKLSE